MLGDQHSGARLADDRLYRDLGGEYTTIRERRMAMKLLWDEDDATVSDPLHETLAMAYKRLFGEELDIRSAIERKDGGDGMFYIMPNGARVWSSYPGGSAIYVENEQ